MQQGSTTSTMAATSTQATGSATPPSSDVVGTAQDPDATLITAVAPDDSYGSGTHHATIKIQEYGTIKLLLDADKAPITVSNFCRLAREGFYDGLTFHRIIAGFMMQGGDPEGTGTGGADKTIKGEFTANGVQNTLLHTRGAISMARSTAYDSASSQFFIMQAVEHSLDGQYAAFGHVTEGIEVVDDICNSVAVTDANGTVDPANQPVISSITITD